MQSIFHYMRPFFRSITLFAAVFCYFAPVASAVVRDGGVDPANLGKGDWIYYTSAVTSGLGGNVPSVNSIASYMAFAKSQGIRYIIVKAATGSALYNGTGSSPQFTTALVNAAHAEGLFIFGYNRSNGIDIPGEIAVADFVFNQGADGFVWDAESEWESRNLPDNLNRAWQICGQVRTNWPNKFLAHAPFDIISVHSSFPYKEFGYWTDAVMPQIYHYGRVNIQRRPSGNINWADANWKNWQNSLTGMWTNSIKPLAPVNHVYGPNPPNGGVSHIPDGNVGEFVDYLSADPNTPTAGGYKGASFWRADLHGAAQWEFIKAATIGNFSNVVNNIVIDNPTTTKVGGWPSIKIFSNGTFYGTNDNNPFGTNYFLKAKGTGSAYVQFTPTVVTNGDYDVFEWHPTANDLAVTSTNVPHVINFNGGSTTIPVNQKVNAGGWNKLGRFNFLAGTGGNIRVTDNAIEAGSFIMVDGIKLMFAPPTSLPAVPTGFAATPFSPSQINLKWNNNANNETTFVLAQGTASGGPYTNFATLSENITNYARSNLSSGTTYYFVVRAANALGSSANSIQASATTLSVPVITGQPQSKTVLVGTNAIFSVTASATPTPLYQWRFNSVNIPGATTSVYTRTNVQTNDSGAYSVVVTNIAGTATSTNAMLTVTLPTPAQFRSVTLLPDGDLSLLFSGDSASSYWIDRTTNLVNWNPLTNIFSTNNFYKFLDSPTNGEKAFYRARK